MNESLESVRALIAKEFLGERPSRLRPFKRRRYDNLFKVLVSPQKSWQDIENAHKVLVIVPLVKAIMRHFNECLPEGVQLREQKKDDH